MTERTDKSELPTKDPFSWPKAVTILGVLIIVLAGIIIIIHQITSIPGKVVKDQVENTKVVVDIFADKTKGAINYISSKFSTKEAFAAEITAISSQKCQELDIVKSSATMIFRGVVWRGDYIGNVNEYFECVDDRAKFKQIDAILGQICEVQATGSYELRYYVDMSDPSKWSSSFDEKTKTIRITAPPLQSALPAEKTNIEIVTLKKSISIKEDTTKEKLRDKIPKLKKQVADRNIPNMLDTGRISLQKFLKDWFFSKYKDQFDIIQPNIEVIFEGEQIAPIDRSKL